MLSPLYETTTKKSTRRDLLINFGIASFVGLVFTVFYGAASAITALHPDRMHVHFAFEPSIPFMPSMSLVYLSMDLLVMLSVVLLKDWRGLTPFAAAIIIETLIGAVFFILIPIERVFPPRIVTGFWAPFFETADTMNLKHNDLPSLHVAFSCTAAMAYGQRSGWLGKIFFGGWASAIAVSTMLIHEHHLVDLIAGFLLAAAVMRWAYPWASRPEFLQRVRAEWLCLLSRRRRLPQLPDELAPQRNLALRVGRALLQRINDLDAASLDLLIAQLRDRRFDDSDLGCLCDVFFRETERDTKNNLIERLISLIETKI